MASLIFSTSNVFVLCIAVAICYTLWAPYIRGRKFSGIIDGYEHPKDGKDKDLMWRYRISYRDAKGGKRQYVSSKREYGTRKEAEKYKKGDKVDIVVYQIARDTEQLAIITSDNEEKRMTIIYTVCLIAGAICLAVGMALLNKTGL